MPTLNRLGAVLFRHRSWLGWWPWAAAVLLSLAAVFAAARVLVDIQLAANGEEEAENWVAFAHSGVPDLGPALQAGVFTPKALEQLRLLSTADEVYQFQLFDARARLVVDSRLLTPGGTAGPAPDEALLGTVREVLASGEEHLEVIHDADESHRHVSVATVPVEYNGRVSGSSASS